MSLQCGKHLVTDDMMKSMMWEVSCDRMIMKVTNKHLLIKHIARQIRTTYKQTHILQKQTW